ncbi:MAG: hypothetical protein KC441_08705 [Anaerolineales bacterium]|nr:hypothetical protein [Anaerolineales bacterium]
MLIDALTQIGSLQLETGQKGKVGGIFFSMDAPEKALEYYVLANRRLYALTYLTLVTSCWLAMSKHQMTVSDQSISIPSRFGEFLVLLPNKQKLRRFL